MISPRNPWVRAASSAQSWVEDTLEARSALGVGFARLQAIIALRKRGDFRGLIPINTSLAETARWKRRVPRGDLHYIQDVAR